MCRFIETIRIEDSNICSTLYHISRFLKTRKFFFPESETVDLEEIVTEEFRKYCSNHENTVSGTIKCRIVYSENIESVEFIPYEIKPIRTLKTVSCDRIDYSYKYSDRSAINRLMNSCRECDDILIIKNNLVTDTSFGNILFFDGERYFTPHLPLLKGTKRQLLLDKKIITEIKIEKNDIKRFKYLTIINAMLDPDTIRIDIKNIF